jgi:putative tryptophan/tyrosine transport system substrate-binding protein
MATRSHRAAMRRREFVSLLGGGVAAWPLMARGQQRDRVRQIGLLSPFSENDPETKARLAAFKERLEQLGWTDGRNIKIEYRFSEGNIERTRTAAAELVALTPDVIVAYANPAVSALKPITSTIPIVFTQVSDPVGSGFVTDLAHPGGNITGFHSFEPAIGGKWLELLKEIAPSVRRAAVVHDPRIAANVSFLRAAESASSSLGVTVTPAGVTNAADIEREITAFAQEPNGGLVVAPAPATFDRRDLIIALAEQWRLPAIYSYRFNVKSGGLVSYGYEGLEQFQQAATYVDRILRGAKPDALPLQLPSKYQLVVNLKAAKAIGLFNSTRFYFARRRGDRIAVALLRCMSLLLAQSGHPTGARQCPLLGAKRTSMSGNPMSAFEPNRT